LHVSADYNEGAFLDPFRETIHLTVGQGYATMGPVEQFVHHRAGSPEAMYPDLATQGSTLGRDGLFEMRFHDVSQRISGNEAAGKGPPGHLEIGVSESEKPMVPAALVNPSDSVFPEGSLIVAACLVVTRASTSDGDPVESLDRPITCHNLQRTGSRVHLDPDGLPDVAFPGARRSDQQRVQRCAKSPSHLSDPPSLQAVTVNSLLTEWKLSKENKFIPTLD
jgi:hypothetical protein